jgi:hypothetical protein
MSIALRNKSHSLFDPASRINSYRKSVSARDKMHGYLRWVARSAARQSETEIVPASAFAHAAATYPNKHLYFLSDGTDVTGAVSASRIEVIAEPPERQAVRLRCQFDSSKVAVGKMPASFQAFLIEPTVLARLANAVGHEAVVGDGMGVPTLLGEVLGAVCDNIEVARILSTIPDLEGDLAPDGRGEARLELPSVLAGVQVPERTLLMVVLAGEPRDISV